MLHVKETDGVSLHVLASSSLHGCAHVLHYDSHHGRRLYPRLPPSLSPPMAMVSLGPFLLPRSPMLLRLNLQEQRPLRESEE